VIRECQSPLTIGLPENLICSLNFTDHENRATLVVMIKYLDNCCGKSYGKRMAGI
jgi:hypothetical protein